jgi:SAM-dependent methyltransferase
MYAPCVYNWEGLAGVWNLFEDQGLNPALLSPEFERLAVPVAVVGCGRGAVLDALQQRLGRERAMGFDISEEMVKAARERGCAQVHQVDAAEPIPAGWRFGSILVATGVLDPLEPHETHALLRCLRDRLDAGGQLWIYGFGQFGAHWTAARTLGATHTLGIANHRLYDLYEAAAESSAGQVLQRLGLSGRDALLGKVWLAGIARLVKAVATARSLDPAAALALVRRISPQVQRRFDPNELREAARHSELTTLSVDTHDSEGVLRLVCRSAQSGTALSQPIHPRGNR